jgi:hypothetical protein
VLLCRRRNDQVWLREGVSGFPTLIAEERPSRIGGLQPQPAMREDAPIELFHTFLPPSASGMWDCLRATISGRGTSE